MQIGQGVKINSDDWSLAGKIGRVIDETVFNGAARCQVEVEGEVLTLSSSEIEPIL